MQSPDVIFVDGSSYLYRAFHALPPLTNSRGEHTGAVYGVLNMLNKFLKEQASSRVVIVFDAPGRTFRDEIFDQYKAHRKPMPDDLRPQIEPLFEVVRAMGLPLLRIQGVEADDVIGTLACRASRAGQRVWISTIDKDMTQLVDERVTVVNTMSNTMLDRDGVKLKFDVFPEQIVDYLALIGDSSDNIPGIEKVGPKTAAKWLAKYGTLDELVAHAGEIEGKVGENLRAGLETLELSRKLATIQVNVDLPADALALEQRPADVAALRVLYERLEFRNWLKALSGEPGAATTESDATPAGLPAAASSGAAGVSAAAAPGLAGERSADDTALAALPRDYVTITEVAELERWIDEARGANLFSLAVQTDGADYMRARLVGLSICIEPGRAGYVPLAHDYAGAPAQLPLDEVLAALRPLLEDAAAGKVGHDQKLVAHVLANHGIAIAGLRYDQMLESYVWNSTATSHELDDDAAHYLGMTPLTLVEVAGKGAKQLPWGQVPVDRATEYAAQNADLALRLHRSLWTRLDAEAPLRGLYETIEQPLVPVLHAMERRGVLIDPALLKTQSGEIAQRIRAITVDAFREAGGEFNLESPKQLQQVLFEKLQLPIMSKTPSGQPSTAEAVLEELATNYALPRLILDYRGLAKLRSTYTDKLGLQINPHTGRIHTCYNQAVAATGRLSSTDPNLQNIPIRTEEGRRIRQAFVPPPGYVLLAADYSQIELRIMAHLSGDESLLEAFRKELDIHQATAAEILGIRLEDVSADQRRSAKMVNFGLIYGMSAFGLASRLGIERGAAQQYVDLYFRRYPGVKAFMDRMRAQVRERGYVETVFGRRLYLPDIRARNRQLQQYAERAAINAPMQGTAADIIKRAMITVEQTCRDENLPARLIMQVHDELVLEVETSAAEHVSERVRARMCEAADLNVPLKVEVGTGANWDEAH